MILKLTWEEFCAAAIENITDKSSFPYFSFHDREGFRDLDGTLSSFDRPAFVEIEVMDEEP